MPLRIHLAFGLALVLFLSAGAAEAAPIRRGDSPIPGQYIVVLREGVASGDPAALPGRRVSDVAADFAVVYGAKVSRIYDSIFVGFALRMSEAQAVATAGDWRVAYVQQDLWLPLHAIQAVPDKWGLDRIDERSLPRNNHYSYSRFGSVNVYIMDTGIAPSSQEFGSRVVNAFSATGNFGDCYGHGTRVAALVGGATSGVAKAATLHQVRVAELCNCTPGPGQPPDIPLFEQGSCSLTMSNLLAGLDWVRTHRATPAVLNMSLGGAANQTLDDAVRAVINAGVTVVVSAGNGGVNACTVSPARVGEAVTVAASDVNDGRAIFGGSQSSNFGSCVDLFAPGKDTPTHLGLFGGTSASAPHVAGVAALYLEGAPTASPATVQSFLIGNATTGKLTNIGAGSPNRLLYQPFPGGSETDNPPLASGACGPCVPISGTTTRCSFTSTSTDDFAISQCRWTVNYDALNRPIYRYGCTGATYNYPTSWGGAPADLCVTDDGNQMRCIVASCDW